MRLAAALCIAALATPAFAQESVTSCQMELGRYVCRTRAPQSRPDIMDAGRQGQEDMQRFLDHSQNQREAAVSARQRANDEAAERRLAADRRRVESIEI